MKESLESYIRRSRKPFEEMLEALVQLPTVSADIARAGDILKASQLGAEFLRSFGASVEIHRTSGNPIVCGLLPAPGALKTVTVYNHLDVQPADEPEWTRDPFRFEKRGKKYYGRGATDDKGPALAALFAARYSIESGTPVNIQFIWELEEEIGSPHFEEFLKAQQKSLATDSVVVIDSVWISPSRPTIYYSVRGNITASLKLRTAEKAAHSGVTGGIARNPLTELCEVVSRCVDARTGKIKIPGFYAGAAKPSAEERRNFRASGFDLRTWARSYGLQKLRVSNAMEAMLRSWCEPTFEVHGLNGGYSGPGVKTAIAPAGELKISCRLAPGQNPVKMAELLKQYIRKINPDVDTVIHSKLNPYLGRYSGTYAKAASRALEHGFGSAPVYARAGGSDGAILLMDRYLKAPITLMGLSLPDHGYHAPNEYFDWDQASGGMRTFVRYFEEIAKIK